MFRVYGFLSLYSLISKKKHSFSDDGQSPDFICIRGILRVGGRSTTADCLCIGESFQDYS